ncbi:uncharacterized protein (DUF2336 family) [Rhizobium sp. BK251]|nr:uncharacterized protein (DUF2336 family) [Rhizobium sp. BK251]
MAPEERSAAEMAMTFLLDDPSPRVRLALAEAISDSAGIPRSIVLPLAEDQPEIACHVIALSPLLTDADLVDLAARGSSATRVAIAARRTVSYSVAAALAEIGDEDEVLCLLENKGASISRLALKRIAERLGDLGLVRCRLLERNGLPSEARHLLMQHVSNALGSLGLAQAAIGAARLERVTREANEAGTVAIAGGVFHEEIPALVEHLRTSGRLTPSFLMHALCSGKVDFFAGAIVNLSGCEERRVRSIMASGRMHAVRALFESAGLPREISVVFVEATLLWRETSKKATGTLRENVATRLLGKFRGKGERSGVVAELLDMVEKLSIAERRQQARAYASLAAA